MGPSFRYCSSILDCMLSPSFFELGFFLAKNLFISKLFHLRSEIDTGNIGNLLREPHEISLKPNPSQQRVNHGNWDTNDHPSGEIQLCVWSVKSFQNEMSKKWMIWLTRRLTFSFVLPIDDTLHSDGRSGSNQRSSASESDRVTDG